MHPFFLETDQARCYDASGAEIDCAGTSQDGALRKQRSLWANRFDSRNDLVFDSVTGLTWPTSGALSEFPLSWPEAVAAVEEMGRTRLFGRSNWRLPARVELFSLVSHQHVNPALPSGHPFLDVFPGYYWTANECARLPDQVWYVHLGGGRVHRGMKHGSYMVWPISGPEWRLAPGKHRFEIVSNTIRDRATGRIWLRPVSESAVSWPEAFTAVAALNESRFAGWRLPTIRELESLVDLRRHSPAFPALEPFSDVPEGFWSSTTSVYKPSYAWVLYPRDGTVGVGFKAEPHFHVLAVSTE
jgi:hypothetical protein